MDNSTTSPLYSLRKSRQIMKSSYKWYKKRGNQLPSSQLVFFESQLQALDQALLAQNQPKADQLARQLEDFCHKHFKKSLKDYAIELGIAIILALIIATLVRQIWFELYEIPTGSMRPTFKEQDHLTVTKTAFGINYPLMTSHLYFDPNLVERTGIFIWSGHGIPYLDSDSLFMGIFPYTKRYIKRCLGKPGDMLYFYGGKIYGFDKEGRDLTELRNNPWMKKLEHIPFIHFEGQRSELQEPTRQTPTIQVLFRQMNQVSGRLIFRGGGELDGEVFNGQNWVKDEPEAQRYPHSSIQTYSDLLGIRNFAMARLLTKKQVETLTAYSLDEIEEGILYLELRHTPSLSYPSLVLGPQGIFLRGYITIIPLQEKHLKELMNNMYTARFIIKDGRATLYSHPHVSPSSPSFSGISDGTYEFYYGKAFQIHWGGITSTLPSTHPLYQSKPSDVQKLFNIGMEMSNLFEPRSRHQTTYPYRYAYFREGDLFLLGAPIIKKDDSTMKNFLAREYRKEKASTKQHPYVAFKDYGPPLTKEGELDREFIKTFGFKIPEKHYLALGDNHAMSQDSRTFGPIPQANIQGAPSLIIWPPGSRWGLPNQKPYPLVTFPRLIIWGIVAFALLIWYLIHRRNLHKPIFIKINKTEPGTFTL